MALTNPAVLRLGTARQQVQYGVAFVRVPVVLGRRIDKDVARLLFLFRPVPGAAYLPVRNVFDFIDILVGRRDVHAASPTAVPIVILAGRVGNNGSVDDQPVIMETVVQRIGFAEPVSVPFPAKAVFAAVDIQFDGMCIRSVYADADTAFGVDHRVAPALLGIRGGYEILPDIRSAAGRRQGADQRRQEQGTGSFHHNAPR